MRPAPAVLAVVATLGLALVGGSPAAAAPAPVVTARHGSTRRWRAPNASRLAHSLTHAHSSSSRSKAIDALMKGLGVGVYTPSGRRVVGGFERGPNGIYLYTWEVSLLADQLGRRQTTSLDDVGNQLAFAGLTVNHKPITGAAIESALRKRIKTLTRGHSAKTPQGVLAAALQALAKAHHVNLEKSVSLTKPVLDPVQAVLIAIDALRSATKGASGRSVRGASLPAVISESGFPQATASEDCSNGFSGGASGYGRSIAIGLLRSGGRSLGAGVIGQEIKDGIDGMVLAYSVAIEPINPVLTGAFGVAGPNSASPMNFQVKVIMRDKYGSGGKCGRAGGYKLPKQGGIPGVPVVWTRNAYGNLTNYGHTPACSTLCVSTTDSDGVATLVFQPDDEFLPGVGGQTSGQGKVMANEFTDVAQGNLLGSVAQALGFNKETGVRWVINYRDPGGYRVEIPSFSETWNLDGGATFTGTYSYQNEEVCDRGPGAEHPLLPKEPMLGSSGSTSTVSDTYGTFSGGPAPIPIDFAPVAPKNYGNGQDGAPLIGGQWIFNSPTMTANITSSPTPFAVPGSVTPGTYTWPLPVTQAHNCGNGLG